MIAPSCQVSSTWFYSLKRLYEPRLSALFAISILCCARSLYAGSIDFETVPGLGTPVEGMPVTNQYQTTQGIAFSYPDGHAPIIVESGNPSGKYFAFNSAYGDGENVPAPGQNVGSFFLTDPDSLGNFATLLPLIVSYSQPVLGASGVIIDIDVNESYTVTAYNSSNSPIHSLTLSAGMPGTGDGVATPWSFIDGTADIASVHILPFTPTPPSIGFAFDNFATVVPEPSSLTLLGAGTIGLLGYGRRRRGQKLPASSR